MKQNVLYPNDYYSSGQSGYVTTFPSEITTGYNRVYNHHHGESHFKNQLAARNQQQ